MKKRLSIFFYFLSVYVILQFLWWGYHILDLTEKVEGHTSHSKTKIIMIIGEGVVFLAILIIGIIQIRKSIKKELEFSRNQNNFLLSVTHELKTPIASIKLYLQTLQKHAIDEQKRKDIIFKVLKQNEQLEKLIDNILNATRLENKRSELHKEELNISAYLNSICDRYTKQYPHSFNNKIDSGIIGQIDPFIVETIVNNLIENALKYSGENSKIDVELYKKDKIHIRICDNGPGIPNSYQKDVFKKFFRIENEETRTQKGSGLGLFIVKELTHLHKGQIKYYNNKPNGAVFELIL